MRWWTPTLLALVASCGNLAMEPEGQLAMEEKAEEDYAVAPGEGGAAPAPSMRAKEVGGMLADAVSEAEPAKAMAPADDERSEERKSDVGGEPARTRSWFPETFLWQPLVETGEDGLAQVDVTVPDQLTTWRVLGLAHTRDGTQAGSVTTFASVQDVYVDPVLPGFMYVGDQIELPVQAVNTTDRAQAARIFVEGGGALSGSGAATAPLAPNGSLLRTVGLRASAAGQGTVQARLEGADAVLRTVDVAPRGRPHVLSRGGSLSGTRSFRATGPAGADPATQRLAVQVYPGGLAVLQAEVERLGGGGAVADPAYGFAVAGFLDELGLAAGAQVDPKVVRRLRQQAWQRLIAHAGYDPDYRQLVGLLGGLRDVDAHELAAERRDIWQRVIVDAQRADGTWAPSDSGTIQALVAQTAATARVLDPDKHELVRARAAGALERLGRQVEDPYTAAVILASGLAEGDDVDRLEKVLLDAVDQRSGGIRTIGPPRGVRGPFGRVSRVEMLAWTRLALEGRDDLTWRDDLVAELMSGYGSSGFGGGRADVVALEAVATALPTLPEPVDVVLLVDDEEVARARLDPAQPMQPVTLAALPGASDPIYTLKVEGKAPGLTWTARLRSWTPWQAPRNTGVEARWTPGSLRVGRAGTARLVISAPGGSNVTVRAGIPAGTWVDERGLAAHPAVELAKVHDDYVELRLARFGAAQIVDIPVRVQPAFAGRFSTSALEVVVQGPASANLALPPATWVVGG